MSAAAVFLLVTALSLPVSAKAQNAISQGFQTTSTNITTGTLLSLAPNQNFVEPANTSNVTKLIGVASNKPLIELSNNKNSSVQVAVSGSTEVLVSDVNGSIKAGDKITASPIDGIGMRAVKSTEVVGTAQTGFSSITTASQTVTKQDGASATIKVGLVPVEVNVAYYAPSQGQSGTLASVLPPFLQNLANSISGKTVSPFRVLIGTLALTLGFAVALVMLYSSIRANIASIGRNPLAQGALRKGFIDVVAAAVGILAVTLAATFIILLG